MIYFRLKISPVARQNKIITKAVVFSLSLFMTAWNRRQMRNLQSELTAIIQRGAKDSAGTVGVEPFLLKRSD